jgi:hypothetical protein
LIGSRKPAVRSHVAEFSQRRLQLQQEADAQRRQLGAHMDAIEARISAADQGIQKARFFLQRPVILVGGPVLALWLGPWRALRLAGRVAFFTSVARRMLGKL